MHMRTPVDAAGEDGRHRLRGGAQDAHGDYYVCALPFERLPVAPELAGAGSSSIRPSPESICGSTGR